MASNVICGHCGAVLEHPTAACASCGARPTATAGAPVRKSPTLATVLAVVPGLGHIYLGQYVRGLGFMAGFGALQFFGADLDLTAIGAVLGVPMELGGVGLWLFSIFDAHRTARRLAEQ
jgi:hypothetical protein